LVKSNVVIVDYEMEIACRELITDCRPRRLEFDSESDRSNFLAIKLSEKVIGRIPFSFNPIRTGSTVTVSKPGLQGILSSLDSGKITSKAWADFISNRIVPDNVKGPVVTNISACATGLFSFVRGAMLLTNDECDICLAGAAEATLHPFVVGGFKRMGVISKTRPRPFDKNRDGFVPAEGGAVALLMREADAVSEGIKSVAKILGWAMMQSDSNPVSVKENEHNIVELIQLALTNAEIKKQDLAYIHLHGTGTKQNDIAEAKALRIIFDKKNIFIPASSTKALTGHCLGAAGAVETIITIEFLKNGMAPASFGLEDIDPECQCDCILQNNMRLQRSIGIILSYGFGGQMAALVIEAEK